MQVNTPCPETKNRTILFLSVTLPNDNRFSRFFHWQTWQ